MPDTQQPLDKRSAVEKEKAEVNDLVMQVAKRTQDDLDGLRAVIDRGIGSRELSLARQNMELTIMWLKSHGNKGRFIE